MVFKYGVDDGVRSKDTRLEYTPFTSVLDVFFLNGSQLISREKRPCVVR